MTKYGYARVSSKSQEDNSSLKGQKEQLIESGILEENILVEVGSAANEIKNRPIFQILINQKLQEGNLLDGRFRKGLLSGESNTLNEQYTDVDVKLLMSDKTLQHQADKKRVLGHKNPNKTSIYEQGKNMGSSIVGQKHKHCNPNKPELPSSSDNVKHIINALELIASETGIAKAGVLDGARIAWSEKLNVPESSISDQTALQEIIFMNEDYTIERVN